MLGYDPLQVVIASEFDQTLAVLFRVVAVKQSLAARWDYGAQSVFPLEQRQVA